MLTGHCFCGTVRYEANAAPTLETNCHCSACRRTSGAAFVTWFTVPENAFRITSGTPARLKSSSHGTRTFCRECGTPLTFQSANSPGEIDVTTCSLENAERVPPLDHTHVGAKLSWVHLNDGLPTFAEGRPK